MDYGTLYNHALYLTINTMSHVTLGDISPVNSSERMLGAFITVCSLVLYSFLFANIGSFFNDGSSFLDFHQKYTRVLQTIPQEKISKRVIYNISSYYEYLWSVSHGHDEYNDILLKFSPQVMYASLQERYSEAFENSLLFRNRDG